MEHILFLEMLHLQSSNDLHHIPSSVPPASSGKQLVLPSRFPPRPLTLCYEIATASRPDIA